MKPKKLIIKPEIGDPIECMYNPEKYTVTKGVQIAEINIPGLDSPVLQFVRGQNEKVTMELFFDTTDSGMVDNVVDVRTKTLPLHNLLKVASKTHAPPRCTLAWGAAGKLTSFGAKANPWCILETVSEEFSLFSPDGVPLRVKVNATFREAWTVEQQLTETPRESSDRTKVRVVKRGETISQIAWLEYGDPSQWRPIADQNNLANPRFLEPGMALVIPRNTPGQS